MKNTLLLSALAFFMAVSASADVLVYQFRITSKNVGEGVEFSGSARGYMVWNLADNHVVYVTYWKAGAVNRYVETGGTPLVVTLTGFRGRQLTTFSTVGEEDGRYLMEFNRGYNATLKHRTGGTYFFPRTFKGTSHSLNTSVGPRLTDTTQTAVYSPARTIAANDAGTSAEDVVAGLRTELEAKGYLNMNFSATASQHGSVSMTMMVDPAVFLPVPVGSGASTNAP